MTERSFSFGRSVTLLTAFGLASRVLGFVREQGIAFYFGASGQTDAYMLTFALTDMLSTTIGSAINLVLQPRLAAMLVNDQPRKAQDLHGTVTFLATIVSSGVGLLGTFAPDLILAPVSRGLSPVSYAVARSCVRIMFPSIAMSVYAAALRVSQHARKEFFIPALGLLTQGAVLAAGLVISGSGSISGLAWFVLLGTVAAAAVTACGAGNMLRPRFVWTAELPTALRDMMPALLIPLLQQGNVLIERMLATWLAEGTLASLSFADKLRQLPLQIVGVSFVTVLYPILCNFAVEGDAEGLAAAVTRGIRWLSFSSVPMAVGLGALALPIVRLVFEHGAFSFQDSLTVARTLEWYSVTVITAALISIVTSAFYAMGRQWLAIGLVTATVGINLGLGVLLLPFGAVGLAMANALTSGAGLVLYAWMLQRITGSNVLGVLWRLIWSLGMAAACSTWVMVKVYPVVAGSGALGIARGIVVAGISGLVMYGTTCWLLRVSEVQDAVSWLKGKVSLHSQ